MIRKHATTKVEPTFWQRWQLGRMAVRKKKRDDRDERRTKRRDQRRTDREHRPGDRPSLIITIVAIALSLGTAVPSQIDWFLDVLAHGQWSHVNAPRAIVAAVLVEVLCWLCAILYARSVHSTPVRIYRLGTFLFAAVAAAINYDHGHDIDPIVGLVFALSSLMGVGAFELYMHRARHAASGMSLAEIRLWALRWRRHPLVMRAAAGFRAVHGPQLSRETAWKLAWVARHGAPKVPVPMTDPLVLRLLAPGSKDGIAAEPAASEPGSGGVAVAERDVLKLPVGWGELASAGDIVARFWPELPKELGLELPSADTPPKAEPAGRNSEPKRVPKPASAPTSKSTSAPVPTSTVAAPETGRKPGRKVLGGLVRNSPSSDRVRFAPTPAELNGEGTALDRIGRYLSRAETEGQDLGALDRKYIAGQFNVSDRQVRNSIKAYNAVKAEGK